MVTEFRTKKIDLEFDILDEDHSGVLEQHDYERLAHKFLAEFGVSPRSRRGRRLVAAYEALWRRHLSDWDTDGDGRISREEFRGSVTQTILRENGFNEMHVPLLKAIFDLVDGQEKDVLNRREFARMMAVFGVPEADSMMTFGDLDADDDARLTLGELTQAFRQFYLSDDPQDPANRLFGWVF